MRGPDDVLLVTCADLPDGEYGAAALDRALADRGVTARWVPWDAPAEDWSAARLVAVRSPWDYTAARADFLAWSRRVAGETRLLNGPDVFAWNTDKQYLVDLAAAGLPVVPTETCDDVSAVERAVGRLGGPAVVKPRVAAGGDGLLVVESALALDAVEDADLGTGPWVVQPLVASVRDEGEHSVFVLGGRAVSRYRKVPGSGGVLVHEHHGGRTLAAEPDPRLHAEAEAVALAAVAAVERLLATRLDYARVDLLRGPDGDLLVSEVEATEPGLYLDVDGANAEPFADLVVAALAGG